MTKVLLNGGAPATQFCPYGAECPPEFCYDSPVTIELKATDSASGVAATEYRLDGWWKSYTGPFTVSAFDLIEVYTLRYGSIDNAGNSEVSREIEFCVSKGSGGLWRDEMSILEGLKEIVTMRLRPSFASTLPPVASVQFEYAETSQPQFVMIGRDTQGQDGWGVLFDTAKVPNGIYRLRTTVFGTSLADAEGQNQMLYQETLLSSISNVPAANYEFTVDAPVALSGGEHVEYNIQFHHTLGHPLTDLRLVLDLDRGFFDQFDHPGWRFRGPTGKTDLAS